MSSLAMAANEALYHTGEGPDEEVHNDNTPTQKSPMSKTSNQDMETDGSEELWKHLDKFINEKENKDNPQDEEISFGGGHSFFRPPSFARAFVANNHCPPDLQHIFGHPSGSWCLQHQAMPPMPCLMCSMSFS